MKDDAEEDKGREEANSQSELIFAVKAAQQSLPEGVSPQMGEILAFIEGMAPFLKKDTLIQIKCSSCDNYAPSFFSGEDELGVVEPRAYCHAKKQPLHHLNLFTIAKCPEHSKDAQKRLLELAESLVVEDLRPALADKKLYDRNAFASYDIDYRIIPERSMACIEFGHDDDGDFVESGIKICILRRLDPGFGEDAAKIKAAHKYGRPVMVVIAARQIRRQMGIDEVLEGIAEKREMDIVYL
ncbi:hypothetical protein [Methanocrinis sp.]|uniref:hypothetical protein n=1 Tax=Methanocrinis sp. TaxID=3101522 RepID=UPI003D14E771